MPLPSELSKRSGLRGPHEQGLVRGAPKRSKSHSRKRSAFSPLVLTRLATAPEGGRRKIAQGETLGLAHTANSVILSGARLEPHAVSSRGVSGAKDLLFLVSQFPGP